MLGKKPDCTEAGRGWHKGFGLQAESGDKNRDQAGWERPEFGVQCETSKDPSFRQLRKMTDPPGVKQGLDCDLPPGMGQIPPAF